MKEQFVIRCIDTGKYYTRGSWIAEIRHAQMFNTYEEANDEFTQDDEENLRFKFEDNLPENPIFEIVKLLTKKYL